MGGLKTAKSGLKIYVEGSTRHLNVIQNGKKSYSRREDAMICHS